MLGQKGHITAGIPGIVIQIPGLALLEFFQSIRNASDKARPFLMLLEHNSDGASFRWNPGGFQCREQQLFLFPMVASVRKNLEEF